MALPNPKVEHTKHVIEGLGEIWMRPLLRGELEEYEDGIVGEIEALTKVLKVDEGEDVAAWYKSLPATVAGRLLRKVSEISRSDAALGN